MKKAKEQVSNYHLYNIPLNLFWFGGVFVFIK